MLVTDFTQLTIIQVHDHFYYNVTLIYYTTGLHTWPFLLQCGWQISCNSPYSPLSVAWLNPNLSTGLNYSSFVKSSSSLLVWHWCVLLLIMLMCIVYKAPLFCLTGTRSANKWWHDDHSQGHGLLHCHRYPQNGKDKTFHFKVIIIS